jgi:hypothetical protein
MNNLDYMPRKNRAFFPVRKGEPGGNKKKKGQAKPVLSSYLQK